MNMEERKARVKEFNDLMEKAIVRYQDVLGPQTCPVHDDLDDCEDVCEPNADQSLLRTWCVVFGWEILEGEHQGWAVPDLFTPEGSMVWETTGLLTMALDDIRGTAS